MEFTQRERDLITSALYILEKQCYGDEVDLDAVSDLGDSPSPEEVRLVMDKFK